MPWLRTRPLGIVALCAMGAAASTLLLFWPRETYAEEVPDSDRHGDYDEEGMKFGNVLVKGELVPAANTPGGWVLVRTFENTGAEPEKLAVEERVLRTETALDARASPPPMAVILRTQSVSLKPHEKKTVGVRLAPEIGKQITAGRNTRAFLEKARERAMESEDPSKLRGIDFDRSFMEFHVEYLRPLEPGQTAAKPYDNGVTRPARMAEL